MRLVVNAGHSNIPTLGVHPQQLGETNATGVMMWTQADATEIEYGPIHHTPSTQRQGRMMQQ